MRVGILTYHRSHNYGAFLQAYSLCAKLNEYENVDCEIVNYNLASEDTVYKKRRLKRPLYAMKYIKQDHMFDDAQKEQTLSGGLILENDYIKLLDSIEGKYDVLVTGSDEIWRKASRGFPNAYWLPGKYPFAKMSYAASGRMLIDKIPDSMKKELKDFYLDYNYIGVRDECTKKMVNSTSGEEISHRNCDPTFFYDRYKDKQELKKLIREKYKLPNKKIVVVVYDRPSLIRELRKRLGKDYYFVCLTRPMYNANKNLCDVDPFEWADIIGGADFVVTAYYHPMLFALNQNTPFMAIDRRANKKTIETSKLFDLLSYSRMEDRYGMSEDISDEFWDKLADRIKSETNDESTDFSKVIAEQKSLFDSFEKELLNIDTKNKGPNIDKDEVYALYNNNKEVLGKSSSGGVFDALANWVIDNNGYVCAACYDYNQNELKHILFDDKEQIEKCQGSKYFQSKISKDIYEGIKKLLNEKTKVLFTGTPCQVAAIKKYFKASNVDTESLFTCDIICHGVGSPGIWKDYANLLKKKGEIKYITFKGKEKGWKNPSVYAIINSKNVSIRKYSWLYFDGSIMRPSCYKCKYTTTEREGDISIGDFWKVKRYHPDIYNEKGTSFIMLNTDNGKKVFDEVKGQFAYEKTTVEKVKQNNMRKPTAKSAHYGKVMNDYKTKSSGAFFRKWNVRLFIKKVIKR